MWSKPWSYKEGLVIGAGLLVIGILLQMAVGAINWGLFACPVNAIVLVVYIIALVAMHLLRKRVYLFGWLSHYSAAVSSLVWVVGMRIRELHQAIERAQQSGDLDAESSAVVQYQIAVTEAAHNVVLLHLLRCMEPMLAQNVRQNFELLYARRDMLPLVSNHRTRVFEAIMAGEPEQAREASHRHLAFIEEILLDRSREQSRRERSLRRIQQRKD